MDRARLADRPVKLAEAASVSDDPWYSQRLEALAHELAVRARVVLRVQGVAHNPSQDSFGLLGNLFGWAGHA